MRFKIWLEALLDHDSIRKIVLDALDANAGDKDAVLGSLISEQPEIYRKLSKFSILQPHLEEIKNFIDSHPQSNLIELIDFIVHLGEPNAI